ncbi:MAG: hypothetical protein ACI9MR_003897, partial [Myxococcota bacterium]
MRDLQFISGSLAICLALLGPAPPAAAIGDAANRFSVFVPPNNSSSSRRSILIVTSVSPHSNTVEIIDDNTDGDDDDSVTTTLERGESYILKMADGAVNDDTGGKHDGDFFRIVADYPVVVQMATHSNWQHDWVPGEGYSARATSFFVYAPPTSGADNDINVYAYEDDTRVSITQVSTQARTGGGKTTIDLAGGVPVLDITLQLGGDLNVRENGLGLDMLDPGQTYWVRASKGVTVQYGHLGQVNGGNQARDGAGFVPSANGSSAGSLFYFAVPHNPGRESEKELRVVCMDDATTVTLHGTTATATGWTLIGERAVDDGGHVDWVGASDAAFRVQDLYRLTVDPPWHRCSVFEGNWMETGSFGTSDFASAVSGHGGSNLDHRFTTYLGPPGRQDNVRHPEGEQTNATATSGGYQSHLYVFGATNGTAVTVRDVDTDGDIFDHTFNVDADGYYDVVVDRSTYIAMSSEGRRPYVKVSASHPIVILNGNFNDNWMAFFYSVLPQTPTTTCTVDTDSLTCGAETTARMRCENTGAGALDEVTATMTLPAGMTPTLAAGDSATIGENTITWASQGLAAGEGIDRSATVRLDCDGDGCLPTQLAALTCSCDGLSGDRAQGSLASAQLQLADSAALQVLGLIARDAPDYVGDPPQPAINIAIEIQGGTPGATVRLTRVIDDPDPDASGNTLASYMCTGPEQEGTAILQSSMGSVLSNQTVFAHTYVSAGAGSPGNETVYGNILANTYVTMGAGSRVTGGIQTGTDLTTGDSATVDGSTLAVASSTLGAYSRL